MTSDNHLFFDVLIVGAGFAGLSCAICLKKKSPNLSVCIIEKSAEVGGHIVSGAVFNPSALKMLLPDFVENDLLPFATPVKKDRLLYLTKTRSFSLPVPGSFQNKNNYIIQPGRLIKFLSDYAQNIGIDIYPGFSAKTPLINEDETVYGVSTNDFGLDKHGNPTESFEKGVEIHATYTLFSEGCRGSNTQKLIQKFNLQNQTQTYALGIKEVWEVNSASYEEGSVIHTLNYPLQSKVYGGGFIYHLKKNQVALGLVTALDYKNPTLSPFEEFQLFKSHPHLQELLKNAKRSHYSARVLNEGGYQAIPHLIFKGGALIGCSAGFVNVMEIKGIHHAMFSGIHAAHALADAFIQDSPPLLQAYQQSFSKSMTVQSLKKIRNVRPAFNKFNNLWLWFLYVGVDQIIFQGKLPWTLKIHQPDHLYTDKNAKKIHYPAPNNVLTFDRLSSIFLSNLSHREDQPCHLQLKNPLMDTNPYQNPELYYCPAGVYEYVLKDHKRTLQINAQNCIHCKTCDIKDPFNNILWTPPEGGSGPNYTGV